MRVALHTFGCKLNQYETEALAQAFRAAGHDVGALGSGGDLYVVNTCTVTSKSEQKARRLVRALCQQEPDAVVVVTGCYAQTDAQAVEQLGDNVVCLPQERKHLLLDLGGGLPVDPEQDPAAFLQLVRTRLSAPVVGASPFAYAVATTTFHARATLKIQDGCDYGCAYCRVPLARGRAVSRPAGEVLAEARTLEEAGYREIVLTGVNIAAYAEGGMGLAELVRSVLGQTRLARLRLSSLEPEQLRGALLEVVAESRVCPHFHLPVQSGSDAVLRSMKRRYRSLDVAAAVGSLRDAAGDPFIAADLIAGFPGESEADHALTVSLVQSAGFSQLHVFPFSPRPGTAAWSMTPRVPERVRDERTRELRGMSALLHESYVTRWVGRRVDVLVEDGGRGTSANYLKVRLRGSGVPRGGLLNVLLARVDGELVGTFPG
jgi:threonylcarbamoyladenosine tRNA methylthiotransferase MtaB